METITVRSRDVTKRYAVRRDMSVTVLDGIDFEASGGRVTGITGPSGGGKSTLLYCLSGLERPTTGSVEVLGQPLEKLSKRALLLFRRQHIGFLFQSYNLISGMSAKANVLLPLRLAHKKVSTERIDSLFESFGLSAQREEDVSHLSGGEQQRVALIRLLVSDPEVIFADEPTGALDQEMGRRVIAELDRQAHQYGKTVVLVTHDPAISASCDVLYTLRDGTVVSRQGAADGRAESRESD
jgi:putative ABC transport system ATP-binding protein